MNKSNAEMVNEERKTLTGDIIMDHPTLVEDDAATSINKPTFCQADLKKYRHVIIQNMQRSKGVYDEILVEWKETYEKESHSRKDECAERIVADMKARGILFVKKIASKRLYELTDIHGIKTKVKRDIKQLSSKPCQEAVQIPLPIPQNEATESSGLAALVQEQPKEPLVIGDAPVRDSSAFLPATQFLPSGASFTVPQSQEGSALAASGVDDLSEKFDLRKTFESDDEDLEALQNDWIPGSVFAASKDTLFDGFVKPPYEFVPASDATWVGACGFGEGNHVTKYSMENMIGFIGDLSGRFAEAKDAPQVRSALQNSLDSHLKGIESLHEQQPPCGDDFFSSSEAQSKKRAFSIDFEDNQPYSKRYAESL